MRRQIVCTLVIMALGACGASGADKVKDELKKLQGEWPVVSVGMGGHAIKAEHVNNKLVIDGDKLTIFDWRGPGPDKVDSTSYRVKLGPSVSPKVIDLTHLDGNLKGQVIEGVYDVEDDELQVCITISNAPRPDGLYTIQSDPSRRLYKCKRPKKPDEATAKELKKFNGTWMVAAGEFGGRQLRQRTVERMKFVFSDGKWTGTLDGKEGDAWCPYELKDIKADPKAIDLQSANKVGAVTNLKGIYKLDGDELTICMDYESQGRPTAFETKPNSTRALYTLKRQKP